MIRIRYPSSIYILILVFLISCKNTNHLREDTLSAITQIEEVETVDTSRVKADEILGIYKSERQNAEEDVCELSIEISGSKENYKYFLRSKKQVITGDLIVGNSELKGEQNIMLFTEKFDVNAVNNDTSKASATATNEIEDTFNNNAILIVNAGSNKDSFTFFNDCNRKYNKLSKQ